MSSSAAGRVYTKGRNMNKGFRTVPAARYASDNLAAHRYRTVGDFWSAEDIAARTGYDHSDDDDVYQGAKGEPSASTTDSASPTVSKPM